MNSKAEQFQYFSYAKHLRPTYINIIREPAELEYSAFRARRQDPLKVTAEIKRRDSIRPGSGNLTQSITITFRHTILKIQA